MKKFMLNYINMQYEKKCVFSRRLKLMRLSQVLMTVGKLFHLGMLQGCIFQTVNVVMDLRGTKDNLAGSVSSMKSLES